MTLISFINFDLTPYETKKLFKICNKRYVHFNIFISIYISIEPEKK